MNSIYTNNKISLISIKFTQNILPILSNTMKLFPIDFVGNHSNIIFLLHQIIVQYISLPLSHKEF